MEENLFGEAKKIYQKVMETTPDHPEAKQALKIIADKEKHESISKITASADDLIRSLEEDLGLETEPKYEKVPIEIKTPTRDLSHTLLYDLAIAYKEMGHCAGAVDLLKQALQKAPKSQIFSLNCTLLIAICYIENHQFFEAISLLEKTLSKQESVLLKMTNEYRLSFLYHLALAYENSANFNKALFFLRKIEKEDKRYRDIEDRIQNVRHKISF